MAVVLAIAGFILLMLGYVIDVSQRLVHPLWEWVSVIISIAGVLSLIATVFVGSTTMCSYGQWFS